MQTLKQSIGEAVQILEQEPSDSRADDNNDYGIEA